MSRRLPISRPRPRRGQAEPGASFALRLIVWYDEQLRRGWALNDLEPISEEDEACIIDSHTLIRQLARQRQLLLDGR